jgi:hypothetical protein
VNLWVWKKAFKELVLGMPFQRHINMAQLSKRFAKIWKMFRWSLLKHILQKCITQPKNFGKGRQKCNKACVEIKIWPMKLNTLMKTKYLLFFNILLVVFKFLLFNWMKILIICCSILQVF